MLELILNFRDDKKIPLYIQLYRHIKKEIEEGRIAAGTQLPPKRKLAKYLLVSLNTIEVAYQQLIAEGYIESQPRRGLFVAILEDQLPQIDQLSPLVPDPIPNACTRVEYDFDHGAVELNQFPHHLWKHATMRALHLDMKELYFSGDPQGEWGLRAEIVKYLYQSRGVNCTPNQVILGSGTQSTLSLLCKILGEDMKYAIEDPGFHRVYAVLKDHHLHVTPISVSETGIDIEELTRSSAQVSYVTPSHQFPLGMVMPIAKRMKLLEWAEMVNGYILEDDYDGEFRYQGKPILSLQGLDRLGRVIYFGTFSKSLIPSLRISYMILPLPLLERYKGKGKIYKQTVSRIHQHALRLFMENGGWERHLSKMRTIYRRKHKALMTAIHDVFEGKVQVVGNHSGLHILLEVQNDMKERQLIEKAEELGVKVYPTSIYYQDESNKDKDRVLLGFGGLSEEQIRTGIQRLHMAWFE